MEKREKHLQRSSWQLAAARFARNKLAMAGVVLLGIMILAVLLAPLYMSYSDMIHEDVFNKLRSPCAEHPLGTDEFGRDLLARILYGGRISLFGGIATIAIAFVAGCIIGGAAGYFGGRTPCSCDSSTCSWPYLPCFWPWPFSPPWATDS